MVAIAFRGSAAAALLMGVAFAGPAAAQLSESGGPVSYSADALEYYDAEHRLVLSGDVDVIQGDARLRGDRVTLFFAGAGAGASAPAPSPDASQAPASFGSGDIQRMIAEGDVYFVRPTQSARGNRAVYDTASGQVVFTGNVVVASTDNVIRGETMTLEINTRRTIIRPAAGERVRGVLTQNSSAESGQSQATPGGGN
jgi:lipopolysaccharide export system protein LptA